MDTDSIADLVSLDAELLQLPEVSPLALKSYPYLAQDLFEQWLSLSETSRLVRLLLFVLTVTLIVYGLSLLFYV